MYSPLSLYLHIPFCRHRCAYCDFNTYTGLHDLQDAYAAALAEEVAQVGGQNRMARTIFFGGGTPSLMAPESIGLILNSIKTNFTLPPDAEITMEANPGTVDQAYLDAVHALGVNRLSFGMQSANTTELSLLEREHGLEDVQAAVAMVRRAGFTNVSLDLIYGLPDQTLTSWERSLEEALALEPDHLSLYCLTIEPGTPMERWLHQGQIPAPDPDLAADQYELVSERLAAEGWHHYEISNWARPGRACAHNLVYWRNQEYLGLGAGAHGHAAGFRYHVVRQPRDYVRRLRDGKQGAFPLTAAVADAHRLEIEEMMSDTMITQLRLLDEGVEMERFTNRFGRDVREVYGETVETLIDWGLLQEKGGRLLLTKRGWFLSNQVFYRFV